MLATRLWTLKTALAVGALSLVSGCVRSPLKNNVWLKALTPETCSYEKTDNGITVRAQALSHKEVKKQLGKHPSHVSIVKLTIANHLATLWKLDTTDINVAHLSNKEIITLYKPSRVAGLIGASSVGFLCGVEPLRLMGIELSKGAIGCALLPAYIFATCVPIIIGSGLAIRAINRKTRAIKADVLTTIQDLCPEILYLEPYNTHSMLLFLKNEPIPSSFKVTIREMGTHSNARTFSVCL